MRTLLIVLGALPLAGCNAIADWDSVDLPNAAEDALSAAGALRVSTADTSAEHTCALVGAGAEAHVVCWGRNVVGQLGTGDTSQRLTPTAVNDLRGVTAIGTGLLHSCAVDELGHGWCWGSNRYAALGRGTIDNDAHPTPEMVVGLEDAARVHCGMNFTCALTKQRTVSCWGTNDFGQLGDGTTRTTHLPKPITTLTNVVSLSAGAQHVCAVVDAEGGREVRCWGYNNRGQVGQPASAGPVLVPTKVPGVVGAKDVVSSDSHSCATLDDGRVQCWGANDAGQLGVAPSGDSAPVFVNGLAGADRVTLGAKHSCARKDEQLYCWGSNSRGQLGAAPSQVKTAKGPRRIVVRGLLEQIAEVRAQGDHTCAVRVDGGLLCWGWNGEGQLGNGTTEPSPSPAEVRMIAERP